MCLHQSYSNSPHSICSNLTPCTCWPIDARVWICRKTCLARMLDLAALRWTIYSKSWLPYLSFLGKLFIFARFSLRRKEVRLRSMGNIGFKLSNDIEFSVGMWENFAFLCILEVKIWDFLFFRYNLIAPAKVPTARKLERKHNEEVKTLTTYFNPVRWFWKFGFNLIFSDTW